MVMRGSSRSSIETITAGGRARTYMAVIPTRLQTQSPPALILVLHGSNQTGPGVRKFSGRTFDELADRGQAVVVYPDAYKGLWNDARRSMQSPARKDNVDDVAFLAELIDHCGRQYGTSHVFAVGYSNGGQMAIRLAHEIPDRLRGLALIGATQPTPANFAAADRYSPLPVLIIHGTRDPLVPYAGGVASLWGFRPRGSGLSAPATAAYFAQRNGITTPPASRSLPHRPESGKTSVTSTSFDQPGKQPVVLYTVEGGGHVIPNPNQNALFVLGRTTHDINAAEVIWEFFDSHSTAHPEVES